MRCMCHFVPEDVLKRLANDRSLPDELRKSLANTVLVDAEQRKLREQAGRLAQVAGLVADAPAGHAARGSPIVSVFNCNHAQALPGMQVPRPTASNDQTVRNVFTQTAAVAKFYLSAFGRDSIDNGHMALLSSAHYGRNYNNAFWNGSQMTYGDGDGSLFVDFSKGNDVIGHELTHGVTQHSLQLNYEGDAGGLNESISDCFGSMFRQWQAGQSAADADWLIGKDIVGPAAQAKGLTCLRYMADPAAKHCLAPQPTKYSQLKPDMDPHYSSGPPNLAFCTACKTEGGKSWEGVGQVWYKAMTDFGPTPALGMKDFADRTRSVATKAFPARPAVAAAIDKGWKLVGL